MDRGLLVIDGSQGEGGGQIVRSSLSLSLLTGRAIRIERIRASRAKPGLQRQHLTAVQAAASICDGSVVDGAHLHSQQLLFEPGEVQAGEYEFEIGTAGSTTLVLQTLLPALMSLDGPSIVSLQGGTHNPLAPPYEFLESTYIPLLARMGPQVDVTLERHGFFPAGGGRVRAKVSPAPLRQLVLPRVSLHTNQRVVAVVAKLPPEIGWRECRTIARELGWDEECCEVRTVTESDSAGNYVCASVERGGVVEVFSGFGRRGVRAEEVARTVVRQVRRYCKTDAPVGEYLADQLLLPMGLGAHSGSVGGEFYSLELSPHSRTHIDVLQQFLDVVVEVESCEADLDRVTVLSK